MAPFPVDPVSAFMLPVRRITKVHKQSSGTKLSKQAAIAITVIVAVFLIAAITLSIIMQRRRKARGRANKHRSTVPGYSTDNSGGLYGGTPGYFAGTQLNGQGSQEKHPVGAGGAGHGYGEYGRNSTDGYGGRDHGGGQAEAAPYYADAQGPDYGRASYEMPQRPPLTFNPSPAQV